MTTPPPPLTPTPSDNEGGSKTMTAADDGGNASLSSAVVRLTLQVDNTSALPFFLKGRVSEKEH
jgi:hypothetical protein